MIQSITQNIKGTTASLSKEIKDLDLKSFAELSMDNNPIHLDEEFAKTTVFKNRIAHGAFVSSFISAVIANKLPGKGTIYLAQNTNFKKPVFLGDVITATVEIIDCPKPGIFKLRTFCTNQNQEIVIDGDALVMNKEFRG